MSYLPIEKSDRLLPSKVNDLIETAAEDKRNLHPCQAPLFIASFSSIDLKAFNDYTIAMKVSYE
jgi:hypothetical protein